MSTATAIGTSAAAERRSSIVRRADEGTVAAYLREGSSRAATHARRAERRWASDRAPCRPAGATSRLARCSP